MINLPRGVSRVGRVLALPAAHPWLGRALSPERGPIWPHRRRAHGSRGKAVNILRAHVHQALRDEAVRRRIEVRYDKRLVSVTEAGKEVLATFEDGMTEVGDFLVGADGVHSRVRACILPQAAAPRDTQMVSIGGFCEADVTPPPTPPTPRG